MYECSVVIPNYNDGRSLIKAIESIYSSRYEVIVVDDFSDDDSKKIIRDNFGSRIKLVQNEKRLWAAATRNRGIRVSTGRYIFFLDADAYLEEGTIETLIKECREADIVYPLVKLGDGTNMHPRNNFEEKYPRMSTAFMIRRNSLNKLDEYFDEDYKYTFEDEDFFTRCELLGLTSKYVPQVVVTHPAMPSNAASRKLRKCVPDGGTKLYFFHKNRLLYYGKFHEYSLFDIKRFSLNSIIKRLAYDVRHKDLESLLAFLFSIGRVLMDLGKILHKKKRLKVLMGKIV